MATAIGVPLEDIGCALGAADIEIVTTYTRPDGSALTRRHRTLIEVPTLVNADDDLLPDIIVWPQLLSPSKFRLQIDRAPLEVAPLPLSVDVIVNDPTAGAVLPRDRIHLGYDARSSSAPNKHRSDITIGSEVNGDPKVTIASTTTPRTASTPLAIAGGLFNGDALARMDPLGGRLAYSPIPKTSTISLSIGERYKLELANSAPAVLDASVEMVDGAVERRGTAHLDKLPKALTLTYVPGATENERTVTTQASATIAAADLTYRETNADVPVLGAVVHATDVPRNVTIIQTAAQAGSVTTDGAFGSLEVGLANGEPVLSSVDGPYVKLLDDGEISSVAARVDGLQSAVVDATDVITADISVTPAGRQPVVLDIDQPGLTVDGVITKLPEDLHFAADLAGPVIDYDGQGQALDDVTIDAVQDTPFFGRATEIHAHASGLPPLFQLRLDKIHQEPLPGVVLSDGVEITTTAPIDTVEFEATDGSGSALPPITSDGDSGAVLIDTPDRFAIGARVHDFERVKVLNRIGGWTDLGATVAAGSFSLHVERDDPAVPGDALTADGTIADLPHVLDLTMRPPSTTNDGSLDVLADSAIDAIDVRIESEAPFIERDGADPNILLVGVEGIPAQLHADITQTPSGGSVVLDQAIAEVEATLTNGPLGGIGGFGDDDSGVYLRVLPDQFTAMGRLRDVRELHFDGAPLHLAVVATQSHRFTIDAIVDDPDDELDPATISGEIVDLPAVLTFDQQPGGFEWTADDEIDSITLTAENLPGGDGALNDGGVHFVDLEIDDLPQHFSIQAGTFDTGVEAFDGGRFGRISVQVSDAPQDLLSGPSDPGNLVQLASSDAPPSFTAFLRVYDLERANVHEEGGLKVTDVAFGVPDPASILVLVDTTDLHLRASVSDTPEWLSLRLEPQDLQKTSIFTWDAAAPTDVDLLFTIHDAIGGDLSLENVAPHSAFCISTATAGCDSEFESPHGTTTGTYSIPTVFHTYLQTEDEVGPLVFNGVLCLKPVYAENTDPADIEEWAPDCSIDPSTGVESNSEHYVRFSQVNVTDFKVDLHAGDSVELDEDGDPIEDDLIGGFMDIPSFEGYIHYQKNVEGMPEERDDESFIDFESIGDVPFMANGWEFVVDVGSTPSQIFDGGDNDCGSDSALKMWVATQYTDLFELDDLSTEVDLCTD